MFEGHAVAAALKSAGITHVVWIPDSEIGKWDSALSADPDLQLIRVCREGEAIGLGAGLLLGGCRPLVVMQCTGLFEAGDSLRNIVHDLKLPLFLVVGVRSLLAYRQKATTDTCPVFTEPILDAWRIPYTVLDERHGLEDLIAAYQQARRENRPGAVLLAE